MEEKPPLLTREEDPNARSGNIHEHIAKPPPLRRFVSLQMAPVFLANDAEHQRKKSEPLSELIDDSRPQSPNSPTNRTSTIQPITGSPVIPPGIPIATPAVIEPNNSIKGRTSKALASMPNIPNLIKEASNSNSSAPAVPKREGSAFSLRRDKDKDKERTGKELVAVFRKVVRRSINMRSWIRRTSGHKPKKLSMAQAPPRLIDYFLIFGCTQPDAKKFTWTPALLERYPTKDYKEFPVTDAWVHIAFPDGVASSKVCGPVVHHYTVLTMGDGQRLYAAFLRFPEQKMGREGIAPEYIPRCLCIISHYPLFSFFRNCLRNLYLASVREEKTRVGARRISEMIEQLLALPPPVPAQYAVGLRIGHPKPLICFLPSYHSSLISTFNLQSLFSLLSVDTILHMMSAILHESRIIVHSRSLSRLTPVCQMLLQLLHPLQWWFAYVPLVPESIIDIAGNTTPYIIAMHSRYIPQIEPDAAKDVVFLDIDYNRASCNKLIPMLPWAQAYLLDLQLRSLYDAALGEEDVLAEVMDKVSSDYAESQARQFDQNIYRCMLEFYADLFYGYKNYLFFIDSEPFFNKKGFLTSIKEHTKGIHVKACTMAGMPIKPFDTEWETLYAGFFNKVVDSIAFYALISDQPVNKEASLISDYVSDPKLSILEDILSTAPLLPPTVYLMPDLAPPCETNHSHHDYRYIPKNPSSDGGPGSPHSVVPSSDRVNDGLISNGAIANDGAPLVIAGVPVAMGAAVGPNDTNGVNPRLICQGFSSVGFGSERTANPMRPGSLFAMAASPNYKESCFAMGMDKSLLESVPSAVIPEPPRPQSSFQPRRAGNVGLSESGPPAQRMEYYFSSMFTSKQLTDKEKSDAIAVTKGLYTVRVRVTQMLIQQLPGFKQALLEHKLRPGDGERYSLLWSVGQTWSAPIPITPREGRSLHLDTYDFFVKLVCALLSSSYESAVKHEPVPTEPSSKFSFKDTLKRFTRSSISKNKPGLAPLPAAATGTSNSVPSLLSNVDFSTVSIASLFLNDRINLDFVLIYRVKQACHLFFHTSPNEREPVFWSHVEQDRVFLNLRVWSDVRFWASAFVVEIYNWNSQFAGATSSSAAAARSSNTNTNTLSTQSREPSVTKSVGGGGSPRSQSMSQRSQSQSFSTANTLIPSPKRATISGVFPPSSSSSSSKPSSAGPAAFPNPATITPVNQEVESRAVGWLSHVCLRFLTLASVKHETIRNIIVHLAAFLSPNMRIEALAILAVRGE